MSKLTINIIFILAVFLGVWFGGYMALKSTDREIQILKCY